MLTDKSILQATGKGGAVEFLTDGLYEVTDIVAYDAEKSLL